MTAGRFVGRYLLVWLLTTLSLPSAAANHALLVGVGTYPALAPALQLQAPSNDVRLMREVLLRRGFDAAHIETLADGVDGARPPTRAAIVGALEALAERVRPGDWVFVHFSGHGSLQPAEALADGLVTWRPIFLPRDVQAWDGRTGRAVPNALTDIVLRALIDRLNDRGANVFAVFDACHSARLVRGATAVADPNSTRLRQVAPEALGQDAPAGPMMRSAWESAPGVSSSFGQRGRAVYFYAAQSLELADSMPFAEGRRTVWHGLFTWHLAQALAPGRPLTFRQLGQALLAGYDRVEAATSGPLYAGDGLDLLVFGQQQAAVRQWPLERIERKPAIAAGELDGLAEGALFSVLNDPAAAKSAEPLAPASGVLGFVRVVRLDARRAWLEPVAWQQWAALPLDALPASAWVRLIVNPPAFALQVAIDSSRCVRACSAADAIARLRRDGIPGVNAQWVDAGAPVHVRLRATPNGVEIGLPTPDREDRLWGEAAATASEADPEAARLAARVAGALHRIARLRNLLQLAPRLAETPQPDLRLEVGIRSASGTTRLATPDRIAAAAPGEVVRISGRQTGGDPVDVALFWLGGDQSTREIYPEDARDTSRLASGAVLPHLEFSIDPGSAGLERLLVVTLPMRRNREAADFRFLEQSPLERLRGVGDPDLQALVDACFADQASRGTAPALPAERLGMTVYTFDIGR